MYAMSMICIHYGATTLDLLSLISFSLLQYIINFISLNIQFQSFKQQISFVADKSDKRIHVKSL